MMREINFDRNKIINICREAVSSGEAAGCSILIGKDGREVLYFGAGDADREAEKPIRRDTIFRLYSMSKPLTGAAVMLLMQDGKLDLNDPVERYIPTFANPKVCENGKIREAKYPVRIFNLLNCGLPAEVTLNVQLPHETPEKSLFSGLFSIAIGYKPCYI